MCENRKEGKKSKNSFKTLKTINFFPKNRKIEILLHWCDDIFSVISRNVLIHVLYVLGPTSSSKLCEKNKMLASLLAKQPSSTPIPPIPASVISATPQDKLPRVNDIRNKNPTNYMNQTPGAVTSQTNSIDRSRVRVGPGRPPGYLNQMLTPNQSDLQNPHNVNRRNQFGMEQFQSSASSSTDNSWNAQSSDPYLSDLLDEVIDIVPDAVVADTAIMGILEAIESHQNSNLQNAMQEKAMAINAIQKSLMQCETAVKSPSSPTIPSISLPGTPPAYSAAVSIFVYPCIFLNNIRFMFFNSDDKFSAFFF